MLLAALLACGLSLPASAPTAQTGALTQLPGRAGCVKNASAFEGCARGRGLSFANGVAVSRDRRSLYVASGGDALAVFARDRRSGAPRQLPGRAGCLSRSRRRGCARGRGLATPVGVTVSPDSRNVYVASYGTNSVAVFARSRRSGRLRQLSGQAGCVGAGGREGCAPSRGLGELTGVSSVSLSADGRYAYVASRGLQGLTVFARNRRSGALAQLPGPAGCVNPAGHEGCAIGRGLRDSFDVAVSPGGRHVYAVSRDSQAVAVFARDPATGALAQLAGAAGCVSQEEREGCARGRVLQHPLALTVSRDGRNVYVASFDSNGVAVFARDPATGALAQPAGAAGCVSQDGREGCARGRVLRGPSAVEVSPDGRNAYVPASLKSNDALVVLRRNRRTGALTQLRGRAACVRQGGGRRCARGRGVNGATSIAVSPGGRSVYAASYGSNALSAFVRRRPRPRR